MNGARNIYVQRSNIRGLTTAAGLCATIGIGMAIGGGMYIIGFSATLIINVIEEEIIKRFDNKCTVDITR